MQLDPANPDNTLKRALKAIRKDEPSAPVALFHAGCVTLMSGRPAQAVRLWLSPHGEDPASDSAIARDLQGLMLPIAARGPGPESLGMSAEALAEELERRELRARGSLLVNREESRDPLSISEDEAIAAPLQRARLLGQGRAALVRQEAQLRWRHRYHVAMALAQSSDPELLDRAMLLLVTLIETSDRAWSITEAAYRLAIELAARLGRRDECRELLRSWLTGAPEPLYGLLLFMAIEPVADLILEGVWADRICLDESLLDDLIATAAGASSGGSSEPE